MKEAAPTYLAKILGASATAFAIGVTTRGQPTEIQVVI